MAETEIYLESLILKVAEDLIRVYPSASAPSEYGFVFPRKRDGTLRISEQESKLVFVQHLSTDRRVFSVETPTTQTYRQSGTKSMSARIDLTLLDSRLGPGTNIELKAHNCPVESIRKDLEKLLRERARGVWFHTLEHADRRTLVSLTQKFKEAFAALPEAVRASDQCFLMCFCILDAATVRWIWLRFSGAASANQAVINAALGRDPDAAGWHTKRFRTEAHVPPLTAFAPPTTRRLRPEGRVACTGKGARQAFLVLVPSIAADTLLHLSVRGGSYRLRDYVRTGPDEPPRAFTVPELQTFEALQRSGLIQRSLPVSGEDLRHSVETEPRYWYERISAANDEELRSAATRMAHAAIAP